MADKELYEIIFEKLLYIKFSIYYRRQLILAKFYTKYNNIQIFKILIRTLK